MNTDGIYHIHPTLLVNKNIDNDSNNFNTENIVIKTKETLEM